MGVSFLVELLVFAKGNRIDVVLSVDHRTGRRDAVAQADH
jgi:hypothetical protein